MDTLQQLIKAVQHQRSKYPREKRNQTAFLFEKKGPKGQK